MALKKLIVFDLDGTLAESKSALDGEMAELLAALMRVAKVAVISGGDWPQFDKQLVSNLPKGQRMENLLLLPTCGTKFFQYDGEVWNKLYADELSEAEKKKIIDSFHRVMEEVGFDPETTWGEIIENRGSQITFSALGQQAPLAEKEKWDPDFSKRKRMQALLESYIPEFSIRLGGTTSIDVTKPGIDKAYGIGKLRDVLGIQIEEMIFVGDAIFPGGNDYPPKEIGVDSICVRDTHETKRVIEGMIACLRDAHCS
jgi:HAD superfamily hydrolase (TIGR01484 family)